MTTYAEAIVAAEARAVLADKAEQRGDAEKSREFSRESGASYEQAASLALAASSRRAAGLYRLAETAYRRGRSHGRALRMKLRAERWEREDAARISWDEAWLEGLGVAS